MVDPRGKGRKRWTLCRDGNGRETCPPWEALEEQGKLGEVSSCERRGQEERGLGDESPEQPGLVSFIQSGKRKPSGGRGTAIDQSLSPPQCWETQTWRGRVE